MPKAKPWINWIAATCAAMLMGLSYIHSFIYPRTEAITLEKRVDRIENRFFERLDNMDKKLDLLLRQK